MYLWPLLASGYIVAITYQGRRFAHTDWGNSALRASAIAALALALAALGVRSLGVRLVRLAALILALIARGLFLLIDYPANPGASYSGAVVYAVLAWATLLIHHYGEAHRALIDP